MGYRHVDLFKFQASRPYFLSKKNQLWRELPCLLSKKKKKKNAALMGYRHFDPFKFQASRPYFLSKKNHSSEGNCLAFPQKKNAALMGVSPRRPFKFQAIGLACSQRKTSSEGNCLACSQKKNKKKRSSDGCIATDPFKFQARRPYLLSKKTTALKGIALLSLKKNTQLWWVIATSTPSNSKLVGLTFSQRKTHSSEGNCLAFPQKKKKKNAALMGVSPRRPLQIPS